MSDENDGFNKLIKDMIQDILTTFPELDNDELNPDVRLVLKDDADALDRMYKYCTDIYPERFFDILYENEDIFKEESEQNVYFLPGINFRTIWATTSDENHVIIWKYIKLILFSVVSSVSDHKSFGDTHKIFEAVDNDALKKKLEDTIRQMSEMMSDETENEPENGKPASDNTPPKFDASDIHKHLEGIMDGKLGNLAKEIAEETAKDMGHDLDDISVNADDILKNMLKDPTKMMDLVKSVGSKLDERIKNGNITENELMEDAQQMMKKMKDIPGFGDINGLLSKMGINPSKVNMNALSAHMEREMKKNSTKERMRKKMNENNKQPPTTTNGPKSSPEDESIDDIAEWIEKSGSERVFKVDGGAERSTKKDKPKKKKKKKTNK